MKKRFLDKKGAATPSAGSSGGSGSGIGSAIVGAAVGALGRSGSHSESHSSEHGDSSKPSGSPMTAIMIIILLVIGLPAGIIGYNYLSSAEGQTFLANVGNVVKEYNPVTWYFEKVLGESYTIDPFSGMTNSSSSKKGYDLDSFDLLTSATGTQNSMFKLRYDVSSDNVKENVEAKFYCDVEDDDIVVSQGTIIAQGIDSSDGQVDLKPGVNVQCQLNPESLQGLDGTYDVKGWFSFPFETKDVQMTSYFLRGTIAEQLRQEDKNFFKVYEGTDESLADVVYNGEPVMITPYFGNGEQPIVIYEDSPYTQLNIFIENKWGGDIEEILDMNLYLPDGFVINQQPDVTCPFEAIGTDRGRNAYRLNFDLEENYLNKQFLAGTAIKEKEFSCWVEMTDQLNDEYIDEQVSADIYYVYRTKTKTQAITVEVANV